MTFVIGLPAPPAESFIGRKPSILNISRRENPGPNDQEFEYTFSINEYVVTDLKNQGIIEFEIAHSAAARPANVASMYIHEFCCTRGTSMSPANFWDASGNPQGGFGPNTVGIALEPRLTARELVNVGIIVAIQKQGTNEIELILCDPQVGNGPPVKDDKDRHNKMLPGIKLLSFQSP